MELKEFEKVLEINIKFCESQVEEFKEDLDKNVYSAMSWSGKVFEAASKLKLSKSILESIRKENSKVTRETLINWLENDVMRRARCPHFSTSPISNLQYQLDLAIATEYLQLLESEE